MTPSADGASKASSRKTCRVRGRVDVVLPPRPAVRCRNGRGGCSHALKERLGGVAGDDLLECRDVPWVDVHQLVVDAVLERRWRQRGQEQVDCTFFRRRCTLVDLAHPACPRTSGSPTGKCA